MKKLNKKLFLFSAMCLLSACSNDPSSSSGSFDFKDQPISNNINYEYFHAYPTTKILRNVKNSWKENYSLPTDEISISMTSDEKEGAQIIVCPEAGKNAYVDLSIGDLASTSADSKDSIPAANISVYYQKYITISNSSTLNPAYSAKDMIPDMLLPLETAKKYKENLVYGGYRQGLTIEVDSKGCQPGTYAGNLELKVGDSVTKIPLNVEIWDFKYEGRREFKTSFLLYRNELLNGEYDNSKEVVDSYVDFLNDYKVNTYVIQDAGSNTIESFQSDIRRQWSDNNYSSIVIPFDFSQIYTATSKEAERCIEYVKTLAKMSTSKDNDFVKYAYFYPSSYDEADLDPVKKAASVKLFSSGGELDKTLDYAIKSLKGEGFFSSLDDSEFASQLEEEIKNIPAIFTNVNFVDEWVGEFHATFCPYMSLFNDYATRQKYQDAAKYMSNNDLWAYSCSGPNYPYATFHIDDDNLPMRVNGWMNKEKGINGYLYYEVNKIIASNYQSKLVDPYDDPLRYEAVPGDGYLLYPGRKYGLSSPVASTRLANYRDSMEDYDMLCVLEKELQKKKEFFDIEKLELEDYVGNIYNKMFSGAVSKVDDETFFELRDEVANKILDLKYDAAPFILNEEKDGQLVTNIYSKDSALYLNDSLINLSKSGNGYVYTLPATTEERTLKISDGTNTFECPVNGNSYLLDYSSSTTGITTNSKSSFEYNTENKRLDVSIISEYAKKEGVIDSATTKLTPYIGIPVTSLEKYDSFSFQYSNSKEDEIEFSIGINNGKSNELIITNYCQGNDSRNLKMIDLSNISEDSKKNAKEIRLYFDNVRYDSSGKEMLYEDRAISLSNIVLTKGAN